MSSPLTFRDYWDTKCALSLSEHDVLQHESIIAFFLAYDGWSEQEIMDAIVVWRRKHGLPFNDDYGRYAHIMEKAFAMVACGPPPAAPSREK
jgi:hypothetical protein